MYPNSAPQSAIGLWISEKALIDAESLSELLGFDFIDGAFLCEGLGFLDSNLGWDAKNLLEQLGFCLSSDIDYGPHGHGTTGVVYLPEI